MNRLLPESPASTEVERLCEAVIAAQDALNEDRVCLDVVRRVVESDERRLQGCLTELADAICEGR